MFLLVQYLLFHNLVYSDQAEICPCFISVILYFVKSHTFDIIFSKTKNGPVKSYNVLLEPILFVKFNYSYHVSLTSPQFVSIKLFKVLYIIFFYYISALTIIFYQPRRHDGKQGL